MQRTALVPPQYKKTSPSYAIFYKSVTHCALSTFGSCSFHPFLALALKSWIVRPKLIRCRQQTAPSLYNQLASAVHLNPLVPWRLERLRKTHYYNHPVCRYAKRKCIPGQIGVNKFWPLLDNAKIFFFLFIHSFVCLFPRYCASHIFIMCWGLQQDWCWPSCTLPPVSQSLQRQPGARAEGGGLSVGEDQSACSVLVSHYRIEANIRNAHCRVKLQVLVAFSLHLMIRNC